MPAKVQMFWQRKGKAANGTVSVFVPAVPPVSDRLADTDEADQLFALAEHRNSVWATRIPPLVETLANLAEEDAGPKPTIAKLQRPAVVGLAGDRRGGSIPRNRCTIAAP